MPPSKPSPSDLSVAELKADVRNLCRSINEVKEAIADMSGKLDRLNEFSGEIRVRLRTAETSIEKHDVRIEKLEKGHARLFMIVALIASGVTVGVDKILTLI